MTLKEHLKEKNINLTKGQRLMLGRKIANIWNAERLGIKFYVIEDGFKVIDYTISFLKRKSVDKNIVKFVVKLESEDNDG